MQKKRKAMFFISILWISIITSIIYAGYPPSKTESITTLTDQGYIARKASNETQERNISLDLRKLRDFILDELITEHGGFPLDIKGDGYINATFFGVVCLYLLGTISDKKGDIINWLNYSYDEETGGFREWVGANISLKATLWGLLITDFGIEPTKFDLSDTIEYINATIHSISIDTLDLITLGLLLKVLNTHRKQLINTSLEEIIPSLTQEVMTFYNDEVGLFWDPHVKYSPIFQTYLVLSALMDNTSNLLTRAQVEKIGKAILDMKYNGENEKLKGGFGHDPSNPTVFETGLAIATLKWLQEMNLTDENTSDILEDTRFIDTVISFINNSQNTSGAIMENPLSDKTDIFQAYGTLIAFLALNKLTHIFKIETELLLDSEQNSDLQIPVDFNGTISIETTINVLDGRIYGLHTQYALIDLYNNITINKGNMTEKNEKYILNLSEIFDLKFGRYKVKILLEKRILLSKIYLNTSLDFRVGYAIDIQVTPQYPKPGENVSFQVKVMFYNGTLVNGSTLFFTFYKNRNRPLLNHSSSVNGSQITLNYTLPTNISLGEYHVIVYINDTWGFNHTYKMTRLYVDDDVIFELEGNHTRYLVGEKVSLTLKNVTYAYSGARVSTDANITVTLLSKNNREISQGNGNWVVHKNTADIYAEIKIPPMIPQYTNITCRLTIRWDESAPGTKTFRLFNATLIIGNFSISNITIIDKITNQTVPPSNMFIGNTYILKFTLLHYGRLIEENLTRYSSCHIENATINITISRKNELLVLAKAEFNKTEDHYSADIYINPNIPTGENNLTLSIFIPSNLSWYNLTIPITILGVLKITNENFPPYAYVDETYNASFQLICRETNTQIPNVSLLSEIVFMKEEENKTMYVPVSVFNYTYTLSFIIEKANSVLVRIIRVADNTTIGAYMFNVYEKSSMKLSIDLWHVAPPLVILIAYIGYIFIRLRYSRKVSRRFLIERAKRFS